jgi:plastocyanin
MRKRLVIGFGVLTAVVVLAACNDSSDSGDGGSVEAGGNGVSMELRDFEFSPSEVDGAAGETVTINLENTGSSRHTFTTDGVDEELSPGDTKTVEVDVPDGGVTFVCRFHEGQGMTGEIVVAGGAGDGGGEPAPTTAPAGGAPPAY